MGLREVRRGPDGAGRFQDAPQAKSLKAGMGSTATASMAMPKRSLRRARTAQPQSAIRPCSILTALCRSCAGTSRATRRRSSPRCAAARRKSLCAWRNCSAPTPDASGPPASPTRWAGRSTPPACRSYGLPASCNCCSATWAGLAAALWPCAATLPSRARPTSRLCMTHCPATCRNRLPTTARTRI